MFPKLVTDPMAIFPTPIPESFVVAKLFAPKFRAEWSDREIHSSQDYFRVFVSQGPKVDADPKKCRRRKDVGTEILCGMIRLINS